MASSLAGKRIVIVLSTLELGGAERQAILTGRHLMREEGAEVTVVGFSSPGCARELCDEYGIPWRIIPGSLAPLAMRRRYKVLTCYPVRNRLSQLSTMRRFTEGIRELRPDVLMPYTMHPNVICGLTWRAAGAKTCIWNQRDAGIYRLDTSVERKAVKQTPWFMALAEYGADFLRDTLGVPEDRIRIIYNGYELAEPVMDRSAWRASVGVNENCFMVCMVANLHKFKDHPTMLRAWHIVVNRLRSQGRECMLLLAGRDDGEGGYLNELAESLGITDRVRFLGAVKDVSGLYKACDIYAHSAPLCSAVIEAMASGLAVAATDIKAIREDVGPEGYHLLSPPGDAEGLAEVICRFAESEELRADTARRNLKRAQDVFSLDRMYSDVTQYVCDALSSSE